MRRLFGTLCFLAVILVAVALWRGWITVFVNEHQIQRDEHKVERTAEPHNGKSSRKMFTGTQKKRSRNEPDN